MMLMLMTAGSITIILIFIVDKTGRENCHDDDEQQWQHYE
jgi:hypothetical protein